MMSDYKIDKANFSIEMVTNIYAKKLNDYLTFKCVI